MKMLKSVLWISIKIILLTSLRLATAEAQTVQECVVECTKIIQQADIVIEKQQAQIKALTAVNSKLLSNQSIIERKLEISNRWYMQPQNNILMGLALGFLLANTTGK